MGLSFCKRKVLKPLILFSLVSLAIFLFKWKTEEKRSIGLESMFRLESSGMRSNLSSVKLNAWDISVPLNYNNTRKIEEKRSIGLGSISRSERSETLSNLTSMKSSAGDTNMPMKYNNAQFSGWPDESYYWVGIKRDPTDEVAFESYKAQHEIWKHQHPDNCADKKFALLRAPNFGLGSQWHILGSFLAMAIDKGRIAKWDRKNSPWFRGCVKQSRGFECYLHKLSNCSLSDNEVQNAKVVNDRTARYYSNNRIIVLNDALSTAWGYSKTTYLPQRFQEIMELYLERPKFWWRTQATTFLVRPNKHALEIIDRIISNHKPTLNLPPGCISVHVRHGDKSVEMKLYPLGDYIKAVENMLFENETLISLTPDLSKARDVRTVFLSTEDPRVLHATQRFTNWDFIWLHERLHNGDLKSLRKQGYDRVIKDLTTLKLHLRCHASIVTWKSNWSRVIEELKSTLGFRPHAPVWDLNNQCLYRENRGCVDRAKVFNYDWR
jgi:hypothetical protein